jgi:hypothetical protein
MPGTLMPVAEQHDPDRFLYFGYGSNMLTRRLADPRRAPSARALGVGYVDKHRLTFDKISRGTRQNSGKCDMEATGRDADRVYGVLFSISKRTRRRSFAKKALTGVTERTVT